MSAAHEVLERFPALRQSWPVERARTWREQQGFRQHPRRMASWFRDMPDMHTRIFLSNLELPEAAALCKPVSVVISLLDAEGAPIHTVRKGLPRNGTLIHELGALLPARLRDNVPSGQVRMDFEGAQLGSSRAYLHWYNDKGLTSSHEKFGLTIPAVGGYWTVPSAQHGPTYRMHLAIVNLDDQPFDSRVVLKAASGEESEAHVAMPAHGSRFVALDALFADPGSLLGGEPGILFFGNNQQAAMYYYFIGNDVLGTWRVQHL